MHFRKLLVFLIIVTSCAPAFAQGASSDALRRDLAAVRDAVYPALVNIQVVMRYYDEGRAQRSPAGGSGVIISKDGYVLTNFHVAGHTTHIVCTLLDGEAIDADVVADDPLTDISVLKLRLKGRSPGLGPLHYAPLGNSDDTHVGDFVLAMGNPLMLSSSITLGIVSNTKRVFTDFTGTQMEDMELEQGEKSGILTRWIQHDALILPGNSGGPLVNMKGEVIGINELGGDGAGFAIPSNIAEHVFLQVLKYGKVTRGWLGVTPLPVQKMGRTTGTLIASVTPASPADKAGIKAGDVLLGIDAQPTDVEFFEEVPLFTQQVANLKPGSTVRLRYLREGTVRSTVALVQPMEKAVGDEHEFRAMGLTVRDITPSMARENFLPNTNGVMITGLRPGYPFESAQPPLQSDDVVTAVDGRPVNNSAGLRHVLNTIPKSETQFSVAYRRKDEHLITMVKTDSQSQTDEAGDLPQAWLGVKTQVMTAEVAQAVGSPDTTGFRISEVQPWTNAQKAGLREGDVITALNGNALDASQLQDSMELTHDIQALTIGDKATLTVLRGGKTLQVPVVLEATPGAAADAKTAHQEEFDFVVRELTMEDRADHHWSKDQAGLIVSDVTLGGWANIAGLHVDDLLLTVNGQNVGSVDTFKSVMAGILKKRPKIVTLFVRRGQATQFVFIEPDWTKLVDFTVTLPAA